MKLSSFSRRLALTLCLTATYGLLAGTISTTEWEALPLALLPAVALSLLISRSTERPMEFRVPWLRVCRRVLAAAVKESWEVACALVRARGVSPSPTSRRQPFSTAHENAAEAAGHRAVAVLGISLTPNGYVVGAPRGSDPPCADPELLIHGLAPSPPKADRAWPL